MLDIVLGHGPTPIFVPSCFPLFFLQKQSLFEGTQRDAFLETKTHRRYPLYQTRVTLDVRPRHRALWSISGPLTLKIPS